MTTLNPRRDVPVHALPDEVFPNTGNGLRNSLVASYWGIVIVAEDLSLIHI